MVPCNKEACRLARVAVHRNNRMDLKRPKYTRGIPDYPTRHRNVALVTMPGRSLILPYSSALAETFATSLVTRRGTASGLKPRPG
jgi:hypothetical protein